MTKFEKRLLAGMMALLMTLICIGVSSYSVYASKSQDKSMESVEEIYNENNETYGTNSSSNASGNSNGIVKANSGPVIVSYNVKSNDGLYTYNVYRYLVSLRPFGSAAEKLHGKRQRRCGFRGIGPIFEN